MKHLLFLGDAYLQNKSNVQLPKHHDVILNLEYSFCDENTAAAPQKVVLRSNYDWVNDFHGRVKAVSLANNHMLDFQEEGLSQTITYLKNKGIGYFGAGDIAQNFNNPYVYEKSEEKIAFLGYCALASDYMGTKSGVAPFREERFLNDVKLCHELNVKHIIVYIHWGVEESPNENQKQQTIGRFLIDHGCDCVIGQHSHCVQPVEVYKDKYIFYSLGNAIFPNFKVPSFFDNNGNYEILYRKKQSTWNRISLGVSFDPIKLCVSKLFLLNYHQSTLQYADLKQIPKSSKLGTWTTYYRKVSSMLKSNVFVDGKVIDLAFFKNEIRLKNKQRKGEKLK